MDKQIWLSHAVLSFHHAVPFQGANCPASGMSEYPALQRCVSSIFLGAEWDKYVENNSNFQIFERYTFEHFTKMQPPPKKSGCLSFLA